MSTKIVTITVKDRPPCEFEDAEDLRRHVEMQKSRHSQEPKGDWPNWNDITLRLPKRKPEAGK